MKKSICLLAAILFTVASFAQDLPYGKVLNASPEDLVAQKFTYNKNKNFYNLTHEKASGFLASVVVGATMHSSDDYSITVQMGADQQKSSVEVTLYDRNLYENIVAFIRENGTSVNEFNTGKGERLVGKYEGLTLTIERKKVDIKDTDTITGSNKDGNVSTSNSTTQDYSYDSFIYTIKTGVEPDSPWHQKQAQKQQDRKDKGKAASSSADFF